MRRREFIAVLGSAAAWPFVARSEIGIKRVGVIFYGGSWEPSVEALRDGLKAAGLEEGRHIALLLRDAKGDTAAAEAAARI